MPITYPGMTFPDAADIVDDVCAEDGVTSVDVTALIGLEVRGFFAAGPFSGADTIRVLQSAYFFDMPEIDGVLTAVLRGGAVAATIDKADMVLGQEADFETAREQGVEFPRKIHLRFSSAESDYTPTKQTSERRSIDVEALSELTVDMPINFEADDAAQTVHKMHNVAWIEAEGTAKYAVSEEYAYLVPSDIVSVEVDDGVYKRLRIQKINSVDGVFQHESVIDRASAYSSDVTAGAVVDPIEPGSNLPGATIYEIMDLPALTQNHDTLHVYIAAHGSGNLAWTGATVEQLIDTEWIELDTITYPSSIGELEEELPDHPPGLDETNDVLVSLSDDDIASITQAEFDTGGNPCLIGDEICNFRDVSQEGDDYRISHITRGGLDTTTELHAIGSRFVLLVAPTRVSIDASYIDESVTLRVYSFGTTPAVSDETTFTFDGNSQIEWAPLFPTMDLVDSDWLLDWQENKRIGAPNSPVQSVHFTGYGLRLVKAPTTVNLLFPDDGITYTEAEQIADFGSAVTSFDSAIVFGINEYTGEGTTSAFAEITGFKYKLESGGYYMLTNHSGAIGLE